MSANDRHEVITLLEKASRVIENSFLPQECRFNEQYHKDEQDCQLCELGTDCSWLSEVRIRPALDMKTDNELIELLRFAVDYCVALAIFLEHEPLVCECPMCDLVSSGESLLA